MGEVVARGDEAADEGLLTARVEQALALRRDVLRLGTAGAPEKATTAYRLIHSEGDGLGGLVVDVYPEPARLKKQLADRLAARQ